jgi:chromate transporter
MTPITLRSVFFRIFQLGATAYGGPGMVTHLREASVERWGWLREAEFMRGVALCQLIPGATMVQIATYIGYRVRGFRGALTAAVAFTLPAFLAILALSALYFKMQSLWAVQALFKGLGAIVVAILLNACITFGRSIVTDAKTALIAALSFAGFYLRWNVLLIFLLASTAALVLRPKLPPDREASPNPAPSNEGAEACRPCLLAALGLAIGVLFVICFLIDSRAGLLGLILAKIGALAFGGGFTTIPLIQYEVVDHYQWLTTKQYLDGIALGQVTPGPVLITAAFLGYKVSGLLGAFVATVGIFFPSFFILVLLAPYYDRLKGLDSVKRMERGILASFIGVLCLALVTFGRTSLVDLPTSLMAAGALLALLKRIRLPWILLAGSALSLLLFGLLR